MLRIYELWMQCGFKKAIMQEMGIDTRRLRFVREIRKQLSSYNENDKAKLELELGDQKVNLKLRVYNQRNTEKSRVIYGFSNKIYAVIKSLTCGYANCLALRTQKDNRYYTIHCTFPQNVRIHPLCGY